MARSLIRENQAEDVDFISNTEHNDPLEIPHTFLMCVDTPATYSGSKNKILSVSDDEVGISFVVNTHTEADILDLDKYTKTEVDNKLLTLSGSIVLDHGNLTGLADDDHPQYHDDMRGDARYYTEIELNNGQLDTVYYTETEIDSKLTMISGAIIKDHGGLTGLADDDHPQYHDDMRGDARYYTEIELNNGQLDTRYYTEAEINARMATISGAIGVVGSTYTSSEEETSISAVTTPVQKLRLTTPNLTSSGTNRVQYYCEAACRSNGKDVIVRIQVDDTYTIMESIGKTAAYDIGWDVMGGFYTGTFSAGVHTIDLDFYSSTSGPHTLVIRRARLEFWRVQLWQ